MRETGPVDRAGLVGGGWEDGESEVRRRGCGSGQDPQCQKDGRRRATGCCAVLMIRTSN